jgi:hypothetical protein
METFLTPEMIGGGSGLVALIVALVRLVARIGKLADGLVEHMDEEKRHHGVLEEQNEHQIAQHHRQIELLIGLVNAARGVPDEVKSNDVTPVTSVPLEPAPERAHSLAAGRRRRRVSGAYGPVRPDPHPIGK